MSLTISSKIFISEGRGQPVSLNVKIDGCSDHGCNHDMLAGIWENALRKTVSTGITGHYEVETTTEIVSQSDYYFVLGERQKLPNETTYKQDLYAIRASGLSCSRSLKGIQNDLFSSELFEGSEVNENAFLIPTSRVKKVANRLIIGSAREVPHNEGKYGMLWCAIIRNYESTSLTIFVSVVVCAYMVSSLICVFSYSIFS